MNKCLITYEPCEKKYSKKGLARLSNALDDLNDLLFTAQEQRSEAANRSMKMSVQGVQPKLSARLSVKNQSFEIVDIRGTYIIKPQSDVYKEVPENEAATMRMAKAFGIKVPVTGLVYCKDESYSYFIKRFDRYAKNKKYHQEDFAQLTGNTRDTKYKWSMEKLIPVLEEHCTFPLLEKKKLFRRVLFCFITGNEDMHLKNFSLIIRNDKVELSPAYDLLNSSIVIEKSVEEFALPIAGKKKSIKKKHLIEYYAVEKLGLNSKVISNEIENLFSKKDEISDIVKSSFLSEQMQEKYLELLDERYNRFK